MLKCWGQKYTDFTKIKSSERTVDNDTSRMLCKIGGDYNDILHRFMNENMVRKFVLKFPQDNNMALFEESWAKKDYKTAFRAMHTLKGVAVNLGFTALYNVSSALTEKLRSQEYDNLDGLIADVKNSMIS